MSELSFQIARAGVLSSQMSQDTVQERMGNVHDDRVDAQKKALDTVRLARDLAAEAKSAVEKAEKKNKNFFTKLFGGRKAQKQAVKAQANAAQAKTEAAEAEKKLKDTKNQLEELMEMTKNGNQLRDQSFDLANQISIKESSVVTDA